MNILMIELTNTCNLDCWFCPFTKMKREKGFMSMETVELAIKKMKMMGNEKVILHNIGESLLHPQFFEIAEMFKDFNTTITTNACCLTEELIDGLIQSNLSLVRVSIDFDCNDELIRRLLKEREGETTLNFKGGTREKVVRLRNKWPDAQSLNLTNWAGQIDSFNEVESNICPFRDQNKGVVLWDGRITNCCFDYEGKYVVGTLDNVENINWKKIPICNECGGVY